MSKVRIKSAGERFRRAGITATRDGVVVETDDLTEEQVQALANEPRINITPVSEEESDDSGDGDAGPDAGSKIGKSGKSGKSGKGKK